MKQKTKREPICSIAELAKARNEVCEAAWRARFEHVKSDFDVKFKTRGRAYYSQKLLNEWADTFSGLTYKKQHDILGTQ